MAIDIKKKKKKKKKIFIDLARIVTVTGRFVGKSMSWQYYAKLWILYASRYSGLQNMKSSTIY